MLNENDVIESVCRTLVQAGYVIVGRCATDALGIDVHAHRSTPTPQTVRVEAKGATSSKPGTKRFGQPFDSAQVEDHVAKAIKAALQAWSGHAGDRAAIALPDDARHRGRIAQVRRALDHLGIGVFWVAEDGTVTFDAAWKL